MKAILVTLSAAVVAVMVFFVGVHVGGYQSTMLKSSAEAALSVQMLRDLRENRIEPLIATQEALLDGALYYHSYYLQYGLPALFVFLDPAEKHIDHQRILSDVVTYRREHPSVVSDKLIERSDHPEGLREMRQRIDSVLKAYADRDA